MNSQNANDVEKEKDRPYYVVECRAETLTLVCFMKKKCTSYDYERIHCVLDNNSPTEI